MGKKTFDSQKEEYTDEHPWVRQARLRKADNINNSKGRESDEVQLPKKPTVSHWVFIGMIATFVVFAGIALRLAMIPTSSAPPPEPTVTLWHYGSEREAHVLQDLAHRFEEMWGVKVSLASHSSYAAMVSGIYSRGGPDLLVVDAGTAEQLAYSGALLTLDGSSPLYRTLEAPAYFLPLAAGEEFTRPLGVVIPRSSKQINFAVDLVQHIRTELT